MSPHHRTESAPGQAGVAFAPCADHDKPPKAPLGYKFDPVPQVVLDLIQSGKLKPIDAQVLTVLLRFRSRIKCACWCTKATIAKKVGCSTRTVQRSLYRLGQADLIAQEVVDVPDPDEPRNRTGWRIVFLWLAPAGYVPRPGPNRPGLGVKKATRDEATGDTRVSPPAVSLETPMSPPVETPMSPNYACASHCLDGIEPDGTPPSSSSERRDDDDLASLPGSGVDSIEAQARESIEAARVCFGDDVAAELQADARRIGGEQGLKGRWDLLPDAIYQAKAEGRNLEKPLRYAISIVVNDFAINGVPASLGAAKAKILDAARAKARSEAWRPLLDRIQVVEARELVAYLHGAGIGLVLMPDGRVEFVRADDAAERIQPELPPAALHRLRAIKPEIVALLASAEPELRRQDR